MYTKLSLATANKTSRICVVGLGQVGLPTALVFLEAGFPVIGYDNNVVLIDNLRKGNYKIPEKNLAKLLKKYLRVNSFTLTSDPSSIRQADIVFICVPTPLNDLSKTPNLKYLKKATATVGIMLSSIKLVIIESTLPPTTMTKVVIPILEKMSNGRSGKDFLVAYCPERISPGNSIGEFIYNDRIIGTQDENAAKLASVLFSHVTKGHLLLSDTISAEVSKLAENTFRDINIAFANELAILCETYGANSSEVTRLANSHPRVRIHAPGPGVGGPCLPKDPYLLIHARRDKGSIVRSARRINDKMPNYVSNIITAELRSSAIPFAEAKILILGSTYKPEVNDTRYTPSRVIMHNLQREGFRDITIHDPYSTESFGLKYLADLRHALAQFDAVIVCTAHSQYKKIIPKMFRQNCIVVDTVRIFNRSQFSSSGIRYVALGENYDPPKIKS